MAWYPRRLDGMGYNESRLVAHSSYCYLQAAVLGCSWAHVDGAEKISA